MKIDNITYLLQYMDYLKTITVFSPIDCERIEDLLIKIFSCFKNKPSRKKPKLHECHCYSELPVYLVNGWHRHTNQTITLQLAGKYIINLTIPLRETGLIYIEVIKTPLKELNPPLVLKTTSKITSPLNGFLLSLLK